LQEAKLTGLLPRKKRGEALRGEKGQCAECIREDKIQLKLKGKISLMPPEENSSKLRK